MREIGVRLLRDPFEAPAVPRQPIGIAALGAGATPFVFSPNGKKLFTRSVEGGVMTLAMLRDAQPRVAMPSAKESFHGVGLFPPKQRTIVLSRTERGWSLLHLGKRDRGIRNVETPEGGASTGRDGSPVPMTTAERSFGAHLSGVIERGLVRRKVDWKLKGAAGQSFGAFTMPSVSLQA